MPRSGPVTCVAQVPCMCWSVNKDSRDNEWVGASVIKQEAERAENVQSGDKVAQENAIKLYEYLIRKSK